jgi:plastocyanin
VKAAIFLAGLSLTALPVAAASLDVTVKDGKGALLDDTVVWAVPRFAVPPRKAPAAIEQINKTFVPLVTVVETGTLVRFPNRDEIRHHVYSFSPAKIFEIKLYAGTPAEPVLFDKPGVVVLGCNIHDHMIAYLAIVDSPHFVKTGKEGRAKIDGLAAGDYDLNTWHYSQAARPDVRIVKLRADETASVAFDISLKILPPRPAAK